MGISRIELDDKIWLSFDPETLNLYDKLSGNLIVSGCGANATKASQGHGDR